MFVVAGDPLKDIRRTRDVKLVIKAGRVHDPAALLESVEGKMSQPGGSSSGNDN